jgi:hypothetical protein
VGAVGAAVGAGVGMGVAHMSKLLAAEV